MADGGEHPEGLEHSFRIVSTILLYPAGGRGRGGRGWAPGEAKPYSFQVTRCLGDAHRACC